MVSVEVKNRIAQVTVRFLSNLITATRDADGKVIDGNAETGVEVPDVWTFARTLGSRDPNWQLVATDAGGCFGADARRPRSGSRRGGAGRSSGCCGWR